MWEEDRGGWFVAGKYSKARQVKSFPRSSWSPLLGPTSVPSCKRTHAKFFYLANDDKFVISSRLLTQNEDIPAKLCSNVNLNSLCPALLFVKLLHEGSSQPGGKKARGKVSVHKYFSAFSQAFLSSATLFPILVMVTGKHISANLISIPCPSLPFTLLFAISMFSL